MAKVPCRGASEMTVGKNVQRLGQAGILVLVMMVLGLPMAAVAAEKLSFYIANLQPRELF